MPSEPPPNSLELIRWEWAFQEWAIMNVLPAVDSLEDRAQRRPGAIPGGQGDGSVWETMIHMLAAEEHWLNRWLGDPLSQLKTGADYPSTFEFRRGWRATIRRRHKWMATLDEASLAFGLRYFRGSGEENLTPLWQTLLHVANHATHHRSEVCTALTAAGQPHGGVDMIDWIRAGCPGA